MKYYEVTAHTTSEVSDIVAEFAREEGAVGVSIIDRADIDLRGDAAMWDTIDDAMLSQMPEDVLVRAVFPQDKDDLIAGFKERLTVLLSDDFGFDVGTLKTDTRALDEADWADTWKQYFKPFRVGRNLIVKPSWEAYQLTPSDIVLELDPGMAFGTGTHETTALCLELLEDAVEDGVTALDVGTGSGILAIAAAKLGATRVLAVDQDPDAIKVARENIERNGLSDIIRSDTADLLTGLDESPDTRAYVIGRTDLVISNILADVIIRLIPSAKAALRPGGKMIASGIVKDRKMDVCEAFEQAGFTVEDVRYLGEWVAMLARKG